MSTHGDSSERGREEKSALKSELSVTNLSSENNLPMFLTECSSCQHSTSMTRRGMHGTRYVGDLPTE